MISFENISIDTESGFALKDLSFTVPSGKYAVLMGRTGCGKTTLLEILCGLRKPDSGSISIAGREINHLPPGKRRIGYVPQDGALFPTFTVSEHLAFALRLQRKSSAEIAVRVNQLSDRLGLTHLLDRKPLNLSGGEKQRVALGRALAADPEVLLLDEPLSALDEESREDMASLLQSVHRDHHLTVLHVTHLRSEATRLGDLILFLKNGCVREAETERWNPPKPYESQEY